MFDQEVYFRNTYLSLWNIELYYNVYTSIDWKVIDTMIIASQGSPLFKGARAQKIGLKSTYLKTWLR